MKHFKDKVLIVDGNVEECSATCTYLESAGVKCDSAHDGAAALEKLRRHKFGAIIAALLLPKMNSLEICRELRKFDPATPFIVFAGTASKAIRSQYLEAGAQAYLVRPEDLENLVPTLVCLVRTNEKGFRSASARNAHRA
jgi:two-component system alkaline phosphatase synthesis response regulator PhoP